MVPICSQLPLRLEDLSSIFHGTRFSIWRHDTDGPLHYFFLSQMVVHLHSLANCNVLNLQPMGQPIS